MNIVNRITTTITQRINQFLPDVTELLVCHFSILHPVKKSEGPLMGKRDPRKPVTQFELKSWGWICRVFSSPRAVGGVERGS